MDFSRKWHPIEICPKTGENPMWVRTGDGFICLAEFFKWSCTGMCTPSGQKIHTPHMHEAWIMVNEDGDQLQTQCGDMAIVNPIEWLPWQL